MGGKIWAMSEEGKGSTLYFQLCFSIMPFETQPGPSLLSASPSDAQRPIRLLVAEDNQVNQLVVKAILESRSGWRVIAVQNGREAVAAAKSENFDLALMDIHMPEIDGFTATAMIREQEQPGQHLPIIALTGDTMNGERDRCLAAGMDDYLPKPFKADELVARIESVLAGCRIGAPLRSLMTAAGGQVNSGSAHQYSR